MAYCTIERGSLYSPDYRIYFRNEDGPISPLHDIPLFANEEKTIFHMVVEIPRWTNAKMEISMQEDLNPIKQDIKNGKPRFVANCFPYRGYIWNYGALPQTWEDPEHLFPITGFKGDNDPIDVIEIGQRVAKRGEVLKVKVLGTLALIDEDETDWKVIAIDVNDPLADRLSDLADVDEYFPELLKITVDWFTIYKVPDGKPENKFGFKGEGLSAAFAHKIISDGHRSWVALVYSNCVKGYSLMNTTLEKNILKVTPEDAQKIIDETPCYGEPLPIDADLDKVHFVRRLGNKL